MVINWYCTFLPSFPPPSLPPPILHVREVPEFVPLMSRDCNEWPVLWNGWFPGLSAALGLLFWSVG